MNNINLTSSELLFYCGLAIMVIVLILTVVCIIVFIITGRGLKEKLIREYGEPLT